MPPSYMCDHKLGAVRPEQSRGDLAYSERESLIACLIGFLRGPLV